MFIFLIKNFVSRCDKKSCGFKNIEKLYRLVFIWMFVSLHVSVLLRKSRENHPKAFSSEEYKNIFIICLTFREWTYTCCELTNIFTMFFKMTSRSDNEIVEPRIAFEDIPLSALRQKSRWQIFTLRTCGRLTQLIFLCNSREKLSLLLNSQKVIMTEDGYYRDWRGIFLLSGLSTPQYTLISENHDKTKTLLDLWAKEVKSVTLSDLQKNLGAIDRFDVCDDTYNLFCEYCIRP